MPMEGGKPWPNGMFSRRHKTGEAHTAAKQARLADEKAQRDAFYTRQQAALSRTPQEQIKRLDALVGPGVGAKRERTKLSQQIEDNKILAAEAAKQAAHKADNKAKAKPKKKG